MKKYLGHVARDDFLQWKEHDLLDHLYDVAHLAKQFAQEFHSADWAYVAGMWHDLGKFSSDFQNYIKFTSGYDQEAHVEGSKGRVDHSAAGALYAMEQFGNKGRILAYLIAGHHTGLPDWNFTNISRPLSNRLQQTELLSKALQEAIPSEVLNISLPKFTFKLQKNTIALWLRMLFSCLVDADFLDTERFMNFAKHRQRKSYASLEGLKQLFDSYMRDKVNSASDSIVNRCRHAILTQCIEQASLPPSIFSLTVPTGGGKTLSSMAFALNHAITHGKRRIIYVIPYTSIIEQTADIYRTIFNDNVIEHHSNLDLENETSQSRLAAENWDAPIIVTTNVQFFESLFASKTSRVRKLHNIVNSVVIFDEAQQLPVRFLHPILNVIQELSEKYGVSFVFATATQPTLIEKKTTNWIFKGLKNITEIIKDVNEVYNILKRVEVILPDNFNLRRTWQDLADEIKSYRQVLCIVNSRKDCRELFACMPDGTIHLSALMCGEHRSQAIKEIKQKLERNEKVRVISTQLVEAGVDVDFPVVYRALSGLDSIAQAAGRCNREGRLSKGKVFIFIPPNTSSIDDLRKSECIAEDILKVKPIDPLASEILTKYFEKRYEQANNLDHYGIEDLLSKDAIDLEIQFKTAASLFKIIDDTKYAPVLVRYKNSKDLIDEFDRDKINKTLIRKAQRYSVTIPKHTHSKLIAHGMIREMGTSGIFTHSVASLYDPIKGFLDDQEFLDPSDFIN